MFKWFWGPILYAKSDRLGTHSAALAFNFVLSLVPFLIVTFTLGALVASHVFKHTTGFQEKNLTDTYTLILHYVMPNMKTVDLHDIVEKASHRGLATVGFVLAVYTTFTFMMQFVRTLNFIFDDHRKPMTTLLHSFKSLLLMLIWMLLLVVICFCFVMEPIVESFFSDIPWISVLKAPVKWGSYLVALVAIFGAFYFTYILVPLRHYKTKMVIIGALVSSFGWVICGVVFSRVVPGIWKYDAIYGALGSVVAILVWGQACAWSVIAGACTIVRFSPAKERVSKG